MKNILMVAGLFFSMAFIFILDASALNIKDEVTIRTNLHSKDVVNRRKALGVIERNKDKGHLREVEKIATEDPDSDVRTQAIGILCRTGDSISANIIADIALNSRNEHDRRVAVSGVSRIMDKERAILTLKKALKDPDSIVRIRSAGGLARLGNYSGEQLLLDASKSKDYGEWSQSVEALGYINTERVKERLKEMAAPQISGYYIAKASYRRLEYANTPIDGHLTMAKEDAVSEFQDLQYLGCEKLADLGTPEAITFLYSVANDMARETFRPARDIILSRGWLKDENYWDKNLTPPIK